MSEPLATVFEEVKKLAELPYEVRVRVAFIRNFTAEGVEPFLKLQLLRSGIRPEIQFSDYGVLHQELLNSGSALHRFSPDILVVAVHLETFDPDYASAAWDFDKSKKRLQDLFDRAASSTSAVIGINTFIPPFSSDGGVGVLAAGTNRTSRVARLNEFIRDYVASRSGRFFLADWEVFSRQLGEEASMDYRFWYMSKAPFRKAFLDQYARAIATASRALKGKTKKCLVLDCDNTLWGGIIGEDGLEGIKLDPVSYPGNAFYDFQKSILKLHDRGVILAINSKNNEADVWQALRHPFSLLKREHFAASRINWQDKATNLSTLARELNLGLDSFVFVDDNPRECEFVKSTLPQVTVLPVPTSIFLLPALLEKDGLFDTLSISEEDKNRTKMYIADKGRNVSRGAAASVEEYLAHLNMHAVIREVGAKDISRVAQLTQKTNQFNLTTKRYSEAQIGDLLNNADAKIYCLSVKDKFGDLGLTGVLIARRMADSCQIDSLLLSCRVLGRSLEIAFVEHCLDRLQMCWAPTRWSAEYIATRKNEQVRDFWRKFGFDEENAAANAVSYTLPASRRIAKPIRFVTIQE